MILKDEERGEILDLMSNYKKLHDEIGRLESTIGDYEKLLKEMHLLKDVIIKGLEENREKEETFIKSLVDKYGEGKLDIFTMDWITNK